MRNGWRRSVGAATARGANSVTGVNHAASLALQLAHDRDLLFQLALQRDQLTAWLDLQLHCCFTVHGAINGNTLRTAHAAIPEPDPTRRKLPSGVEPARFQS